MRRRLPTLDNRAMSGKWQAFFVVIGFAFGFPLVGAIWPVATRERIADVLGIGLSIFTWLLEGTTGYILVIGFIIGGWLVVLGAMYMALEKIYYWIQSRQDDTVNEYQIK